MNPSHFRAQHDEDPANTRKIAVIQGEYRVIDDPNVVLTTVLGSCVAACIRDPVAGIGGMNHFLLANSQDSKTGSDQVRYGAYAMELLINDLLKRGARRDRLEAKLFGGAKLFDTLQDIGDSNASFAEQFMRDEGIPMTGSSLRGRSARRVEFWPVSGRIRQRMVEDRSVAEQETRLVRRAPAPVDTGAVELF
ncbi:MAG: chemotaxis protein CheD [Caulobacteraceae bacterium]|nr:chemotaxis protein CheD [Caulobacteraceae bacterium]